MRRLGPVRLPAALALALAASPAVAGGPLALCESGRAFVWGNGGANIVFNPDQGNLGPLTHAMAVAAVADSFDEWQAVPSSTISYVQGAELPLDVDITNFGPFLEAPAPDGLSAIVFDDTGEIFDLLFGPDSGILGFAGPEWGDPSDCTIFEGYAFLNGPTFEDLVAAKDVMVHEFGHFSGLAHTVVNGQIFLAADQSGPTPFNTFGNPPSITVIETMYPFYFGPGSGFSSPQADDIAMISTLYPEAFFASGTGSISGRILASNGTTPLSGVNVIARNVANPFLDSVSAISGDFADPADPADPFVGTYRLNGLTPGAQYAVYVDQLLAGGFSTDPILLPGFEEFWNGANESSNPKTDSRDVFTPILAAAGSVRGGIDVIFNTFQPGEALPVGDDGSVNLALPFSFKLCGQSFDSVYVNANGNLTFGAPSPLFSESAQGFLGGPPRIAALWDDLDPSSGGKVSFQQDKKTFTVTWEGVPEFFTGGSNTFSIKLSKNENSATIQLGALSARDGLAGLSCGGKATSGFENEVDLSSRSVRKLDDEAAVFEIFTENDNDLAGRRVTFEDFKGQLKDPFHNNHDVKHAVRIDPPFDTSRFATQIQPGGADFFKFRVKAGDILALEVVRGAFDSLLGVFDADTGEFLAGDDDGGGGLLSRLLLIANVDLNLAVAVSSFPDVGFTGAGAESGRYVLVVNTYQGEILQAGDDTSNEVALPFGFRFAGQTWGSVFVNSNGNLTFGTGSSDFSESVPELLAGPPRLAPLWDDMDATTGVVIAEQQSPWSTKIHFVSVPEFFSDSPNYFATTLIKGGLVWMEWGATARDDALVGLSVGGGAADPGETDLSDRRFPLFGGKTRYEQFIAPDPFDLNFRAALFVPGN